MNVLSMGLPFGAGNGTLRAFRSQRSHEVRTLAVEGPADYSFTEDETAAQVVERIAHEWSPDILLCWMPELFPPPLELEQCPIKTVALISDWNLFFPQLEHNLARYDLVLSDKLGAKHLRLRQIRPRYCGPLYSHISGHHRKLDIEKDIDILFVGNLNHVIHAERARCLQQAAALSREYRVVITTDVFDEDYVQLLNRARIVLNHSVRSELNLRCFETLGCGSALFLEDGNVEARDHLQDTVEVVFYRPESLVELLRHYLRHPRDLARIAAAGHAKAEALAAENRLDALIEWVARQPRGARPFRSLSPEERALADLLQYLGSQVETQRERATGLSMEAAKRHPDRAEFLLCAGLACLHQLSATPSGPRKPNTKEGMRLLNQASCLAPDAVTPWMNLALVCRQAGGAEAEEHCLEAALQATATTYGGLLAGMTLDPYYVAWRRALATKTEKAEILWAAAAARLAEIELDRDRYKQARARARQSIEWWPGVGLPHRLWAIAESRLGRVEEAAEILEQSLPLTAFDAEHRMELVRAWAALGKMTEAYRLAEDSARLFDPCSGGEETARAFRTCLAEIPR